ncbi:hypothetical protein BH24ACT3_BH24ACT3_17970 [soil metagenome]
MGVVQDERLPALVEARHRLAGELLAAAARHSVIVDELDDLMARKDSAGWNSTDRLRYEDLRQQRAEARHRHDQARMALRRLASGLGPVRIPDRGGPEDPAAPSRS